jgi:hypothetical protein
VKDLTVARDAALVTLEKRNGELLQLQHENRSITEKLRESIVRELNAQEAASASAATANQVGGSSAGSSVPPEIPPVVPADRIVDH